MSDWHGTDDLDDTPAMVCTTHRRFIPCRRDDGTCNFSTTTDDVWAVAEYQMGIAR